MSDHSGEHHQQQRSWQIRMASVVRQFTALTRSDVLDNRGRRLTVHGIVRAGEETLLSVTVDNKRHDFTVVRMSDLEPAE